MGYLIALALLVAAALLHPYGRRLLAVMFGALVIIVAAGAGVPWLGNSMQNRAIAERQQAGNVLGSK